MARNEKRKEIHFVSNHVFLLFSELLWSEEKVEKRERKKVEERKR